MRTILCIQPLSAEYLERIRLAAPGWQVICLHDRADWLPYVKEAEIIVGWDAAIADLIVRPETKLKWVQAYAAGVDGMPLHAFERNGIVLTTGSGVHAYPISEAIFAMLLSLTREVHLSIRKQLGHHWQQSGALGEAHGKTMGLIGLGAIGEETAKIAKAFDMTVLGVRRSAQPSPHVDRIFSPAEMDRVLEASDFVVVTLPLTPETYHFMGKHQFEKMKQGAYFFNVGRGRTTDEAALTAALQSGKLAGAGLDVFEQEPLPVDSPLWKMDNVIVTPHNAGITSQYEMRFIPILLANLHRYVEGEAPSVNRVDLKMQY